ncbi:cryptochrome/photolyase family protein [Thiothrix subterranea]|uniref:Deoxyribodipyrimidine photo-lyase n=1 Tax=Thiothrix subterranea TaxID=2735563 RepID=A0AA51MV86_9GAMM|nr:deoxyribodipyrimidine photo-lyase [Thiothrix subterranea]WML88981.1 deoxyribodipyrimidine photo-lyase [Thiothrix subterranea]
MTIAIVWLRQDLRLADNPALYQACRTCEQVIPVFIDDPLPSSISQLGAASRVWLHHSLQALDTHLQTLGNRLILRKGAALPVLQQLIASTGATHVYWNRVYDPASLARDKHIKETLKQTCEVHSFNASLLNEPWEVLKADGTPYKVFTPFWKAMLKHGIQQLPLPMPERMVAPANLPDSLPVDALGLLPTIRWDTEMMTHWQVGEAAAMQKLLAFLPQGADYKEARNLPAQTGTARLSPHLHFGEISPRQAVYHTEHYLQNHPEADGGLRHFLQEIGWREFSYHLLYHFPHTQERALDARFDAFPWAEDYAAVLSRWQQGQTGFPIIDAGMRELWQTGWMHNRVRMIVASLLTKNLLVPWQVGEQWFRDTLVDADLASNVFGWQWTAGCGADAAPYFRIFNPILQSQKFDPEGEYIRRWVPELHARDNKQVHLPRELGDGLRDYPLPIVDLKASRKRALMLFNCSDPDEEPHPPPPSP